MSYIIENLKELEKLINDRTYIERLKYDGHENINMVMSDLTDLKYLNLGSHSYDHKVDLTHLTNLTHLEYNCPYKLDLTNLSNLLILKIGDVCGKTIDFTNLTDLRILSIGSKYKDFIDLSKFPKLYSFGLGYTVDVAKNLFRDYNDRIKNYRIEEVSLNDFNKS